MVIVVITVPIFLPWTQNIRASGTVTALRMEHRPQQVQALIAGRIEKWFVKEGDLVKKGDTLAQLSEVKSEYLDPGLLQRTSEQIEARKLSIESGRGKASATAQQITAMAYALENKIEIMENRYRQAQLNLVTDSMASVAAVTEWKIMQEQYNRHKALYDSGLVSLTQLENRSQALQASLARKTGADNKVMAARQELSLIRSEAMALQQEYNESMAKASGERFGALAQVAIGQGEIASLENQYASLAIRNKMYYILAPQNGQVTQAANSGIGEVVKEGEVLLHIVPDRAENAVEMFVRPVDLPLIHEGQRVRFLFDGFPAIVFSGWPEASYGTYQGTVAAIENNVGVNGKYRVLVREDVNYKPWPSALKMGNGAKGIALLKNVPLWYELWRNINSFPPDHYSTQTKEGRP